MMKIAILLLLSSALHYIEAQDIIIKTNGDTIGANIIGGDENEIIFRKPENPQGPRYHVLLKEIRQINYYSHDTLTIQPAIVADSVLILKIDQAIRSKQPVVLYLKGEIKERVVIICRYGSGSIMCKVKNKDKQDINISDIIDIVPVITTNRGSFGAGFGIPYGGLIGLNIELILSDEVCLSLGAGTLLEYGFGADAGLLFYVRNYKNTWRPRFSIYYGTNTVTITKIISMYNQRIIHDNSSGFTVGFGQKFVDKSKRTGINLDIMYIIYPSESENGNLKVSFGLMYNF